MKIDELTREQLQQVKINYFVNLGGQLTYTNYAKIDKLIKDKEIIQFYGDRQIDYSEILENNNKIDLNAFYEEQEQIIDQQHNARR